MKNYEKYKEQNIWKIWKNMEIMKNYKKCHHINLSWKLWQNMKIMGKYKKY